MIVLDIETSGLTSRNGIWQIGALELEHPENSFLQECRIDDKDEVTTAALKICGKSEAELRDTKKQSQRDLVAKYLNWVDGIKQRIILGENIGWDCSMIQDKSIKYGLENLFHNVHGHRTLDLHTIAQEKWREIHGEYLLDKDGRDALGLQRTLEFVGIPDIRRHVGEDGRVKQEGTAHNALEDCRLEAEVYWRLKHGEKYLLEYHQFKVPRELMGVKK